MTTYVANFPLNLDGTVATADNADGDENNIPGWTAVSPVHASGELRPYTVTADPDVLQGAYIECDDTGFGDVSGRLEFDAVGTIAASTEVDWLLRFRVDVIHASYPSAGYFLDNGSGNGYALHIEADGDVRLWYIQGVSLWNSIGASIPKGAVVDEWYWARVHKTAGGKWSWKLWAGAYTEEPAGWDLGNGGEEGTSETTVTSGEVGIGLWHASAKADYNFFSIGIGEEAPGPFVRRVKTPPHEPLGLPPRVWTKQPPAGTPIDWTNPITRGLAFVFDGQTPMDLVTRRSGTFLTGTSRTPAVDGKGLALLGDGTADACYEDAATRPAILVGASSPLSGVIRHWTTDTEGELFSQRAGSSMSWALFYNDVKNLAFRKTGTAQEIADPSDRADGKIHTAGFSMDGTNATGYWDGVAQLSPAISGTPSVTARKVRILDENGGSFPLTGGCAFAAVWTRVLTPAEQRTLAENPWQIFKPRSLIAYKPVHRHLVMT